MKWTKLLKTTVLGVMLVTVSTVSFAQTTGQSKPYMVVLNKYVTPQEACELTASPEYVDYLKKEQQCADRALNCPAAGRLYRGTVGVVGVSDGTFSINCEQRAASGAWSLRYHVNLSCGVGQTMDVFTGYCKEE